MRLNYFCLSRLSDCHSLSVAALFAQKRFSKVWVYYSVHNCIKSGVTTLDSRRYLNCDIIIATQTTAVPHRETPTGRKQEKNTIRWS